MKYSETAQDALENCGLDKEDIEANFRALKERKKANYLPNPKYKADKNTGSKIGVLFGGEKGMIPIGEIPVHVDFLEKSRNNPLFEKLNFPSLPKLERYIDKHRSHLIKVQKFLRQSFFDSLHQAALKEQLVMINACICQATERKTALDNEFLKQLKERRQFIQSNIDLQENEKTKVKGGRPIEFDRDEIKTLFNELKTQKEFQKKNGTPHKTNIRKEIQERLTEYRNEQEVKPSMKTIKRAT